MENELLLKNGETYVINGNPHLIVNGSATIICAGQVLPTTQDTPPPVFINPAHLIYYTDEQIAVALLNIVGKGKTIDSKQKWGGVQWHLIWSCNYPTHAKQFCERVLLLPGAEKLEIGCFYNNIRQNSTLSFMYQDPRGMAGVMCNKQDRAAFLQAREVVIALEVELQKQLLTIPVKPPLTF